VTTLPCPSCGETDVRVFHEQTGIPVNSCLLLPDAGAAREFPRGDLVLAFCRACGFIYNAAFDKTVSEYSARYEETQGFSPRFRAFARDLAQRWIDTYNLRAKHIVEIGCGKGEFLALMCELGGNRGTGIDPSYRPERMESAAGIEFIRDFYSERYRDLTGDAIICRHTLEHIQPTRQFVETVRASVEDRTDPVILFELPDVYRVLREIAFWDIYYEHCSYFTLGSLASLFRRCGFDVLNVTTEYDDQYITVEAVPASGREASPPESDVEQTEKAVDYFEANYPARVAEWRRDLQATAGDGRKLVLWGGGSKGVAYLTTLGISDEVEYVVDVNPYKQNMFMAGTGQKVVAPEFLREYRPDVVVAMNGIYRDEIQADLDALGIEAELRTV